MRGSRKDFFFDKNFNFCMASVLFDTANITDWPSFHDQCYKIFGFPDFYGRNMNAWIDCFTYLADDDGMSRFVLEKDEQLFIHILNFKEFLCRLPEICSAFLECTAVVNQRYISCGEIPRLVLVLQ